MEKYISNLIEINEKHEKIKGFWDDFGHDMHIAVVPSHTNYHIILSTEHWIKSHHINTNRHANQIWDTLKIISQEIGRTYIISEKGKYMYINKLNLDQITEIYNIFKNHFGNDIIKVWEIPWNIENSILPI